MFNWKKIEALFDRATDAMDDAFEAVEVEMESAFAESSKRTLRTHTVKMMPSGIVATLSLPQDMSDKEAEELCRIIRKIAADSRRAPSRG